MQGKLERVDRARREFIANASHELRTPIFSLGGFVELLQDEELDDDDARASSSRRDRRAGRAAAEARHRPARPLAARRRARSTSTTEQVDLAELAGSVAREFVPALDAHGSTLTLELDGRPRGGGLRS